MALQLDPVELGFKRPFTQEVAETLRLRNPNAEPVAFKVKTTAPKQYCVRPNSGRIEAGQEVDVQVLLQAMREDPPPDAKCRDKFLVQSVAISADQEVTNMTSVWSNIEQTARSSIQERKIRVHFLPADGAASTPVRKPHGAVNGEDLPAYSSPMSNAATTPMQTSTAPVGSVSKPESRPADSRDIGDAQASATNPATSTISGAAAATASSVYAAVPSSDQMKEQLAAAQEKIASLTEQVQEQGLRQRKVDSAAQDSKDRASSGTSGMGMQQVAPSGVPVPITAGLCLLSFLIAYLLF